MCGILKMPLVDNKADLLNLIKIMKKYDNAGLYLNSTKTKINGELDGFTVDDEQNKSGETFGFLGSMIPRNCDTKEEIP